MPQLLLLSYQMVEKCWNVKKCVQMSFLKGPRRPSSLANTSNSDSLSWDICQTCYELILHRHTNINRNNESGLQEVSRIMNYNLITAGIYENYCKERYYRKKIPDMQIPKIKPYF